VVFLSDALNATGGLELFAVPVDGSTHARRLLAGRFRDLVLSPDGKRVALLSESRELGAIALDGLTPAVGLAPGFHFNDPTDPFAEQLAFTADGARLVFRVRDPQDAYLYRLFSVPLDGSSPALSLTPGHSLSSSVQPGFALTPDGRTALYRLGEDDTTRAELLRVAVDGASAPVRISRAPERSPVPVGVFSFEISTDGAHVTHIARQTSAGVRELFECSLTA